MLGLGKSGGARLSQLIAKKKYGKAIEIIRHELKSRRNDPKLRRQLADVLAMAGRPEDAVPILLELADDLALSGGAGQAIAILKRAQRLGAGKDEVEERLAYLIAQQKAPSPDPWQRAKAVVGSAPPPPPKVDTPQLPQFPGDLEEISDEGSAQKEAAGAESVATEPEAKAPEAEASKVESKGPVPESKAPEAESKASVPEPKAPEAAAEAAPATPAPGPETQPPLPPTENETAPPAKDQSDEDDFDLSSEDEGTDDEFRDEVLGLIEDVFSGRAAPESAEMSSLPVVQTALFPDFSAEELVEVIRGLELRTFEAGEIIVTEGEPGQSLFVLTTGAVRAYVKDKDGRSSAVRVLGEGDFFGEVSLLEGSDRTATITAAGPVELLEIDRLTLGNIAHKHPRVWSVVRSFYEKRARSEEEVAARGG